jgi:hypothetical protein
MNALLDWNSALNAVVWGWPMIVRHAQRAHGHPEPRRRARVDSAASSPAARVFRGEVMAASERALA